MSVRRSLLGGVLLALSLAPSSAARTIATNWHEHMSYAGGSVTFRVTKIEVTKKKWAVTASFTNRTKHRFRLKKHGQTTDSYGAGFSLAYPRPREPGQVGSTEFRFVPFSGAHPGFPKYLRAGKTWTGTFGGSHGKLPRHRQIHVMFGFFELRAPGIGFSWMTDHTFTV